MIEKNTLSDFFSNKRIQIAKQMALVLAMLLMGSMARAATVDEATAKKVAANVLGVSESQLVNRTTRLYNSYWRTHMYLFIPQSGTGFALISANDYAMPVLGYSTTSVFDSVAARNSYSGIYQWLANCYSQLNTLKGGSYAASAAVTAGAFVTILYGLRGFVEGLAAVRLAPRAVLAGQLAYVLFFAGSFALCTRLLVGRDHLWGMAAIAVATAVSALVTHTVSRLIAARRVGRDSGYSRWNSTTRQAPV